MFGFSGQQLDFLGTCCLKELPLISMQISLFELAYTSSSVKTVYQAKLLFLLYMYLFQGKCIVLGN